MDQQQNQIRDAEKTSVDIAGSDRGKKSAINIVTMVLLAIVFAAVTAMVYLVAKQAEVLSPDSTTEMQKTLFPLLSGVIIGGMTALWLFYQSYPRAVIDHKPKAWFFPVLCGALTLVLASIAYIGIGMWPIGEKSAMIVDLHHQYGPMLSQLRDMLLNGGSVLYTFEVGTGTSFIPLFAYYLASPFNLILVLLPQALLTEGILLITLIKFALTGAFMALCMQYIFKRRSYAGVAVGLMYALMMYMLAYSWDIMWLDCVMVLPLCIMGFEMMMRTGKYLLYVLSLAYILYSNYYIGFMVCIFLVLYFVAFFFRARRNGVQQTVGFARFAIGSLLGGGLAAFILLPAFLSLGSTSAAGGTMPEFGTNFNVFELIGRGLYGVEPTIRSGNLPNTYCGVLAVLALPIFATMKSIPMRRRLAYLGLFGFMGLSLVINQIDLFWHGMHSPNDLPYRFSFLYSFALLLIAYEVLYRIEDITPLQIGASIFGIGVYLVVEENFGTEGYSYASLYLSFALMIAYGVVMLLVSQKKLVKQVAYVLIAVIVTAELLFNSAETFRQLDRNEHYTRHVDYLDNDVSALVQSTVNRMEEIGDKNADGDFYRMEFYPDRTTTDTALFDYRGIKVFASSGSYDMTQFMGSMGYPVNGVNSQLYKNFVPIADSLLGIKYVALKDDYTDHPQLTKLEKVEVAGDYFYIYENRYALPLGYMVEDEARDWTISYYNPMVSHNSFFRAMTGIDEDILQCLQIEPLNSHISRADGVSNFTIDSANTAVFKATVQEEGQVFVHVDCRAAKGDFHISVNGQNIKSMPHHEPYVVNAGILPAGTEVQVTVSTDVTCQGNILIATLNEDVFERGMQMLASNPLKIDRIGESDLHGTIHTEKGGTLMTSIVYDEGWTVKVDGQKVDTFEIGDALLAIELEAGDHEIEFSYMPKGFVLGLCISIVSVLALVLLLDYVKRRDTGKGFIPFLNKKETVNEIEQQGADAQ